MPVILRRGDDDDGDNKPRISTKTAVIIGVTVGATYLYITVILIFVFLRRRRKKRKLYEARRSLLENPETILLGFNDRIPSSRSEDTSRVHIRSPTRRSNRRRDGRLSLWEGGEGSAGNLWRHPEPRIVHHPRQSYSTIVSSRPDNRLRSIYSDGTIIRSPPRGSGPFWMFESANSYPSPATHESSFHTFRRHSESSLTPPPSSSFPLSQVASGESASASVISMPTSVFISEMHARYPSGSILPPLSLSTKSFARIRHIPRSRSVSITSPTSPTSSRLLVREMHERQEDGFLPPVPIRPLMRKRSIERIVSGEYFAHRKSRSRTRAVTREILRSRERAKLRGKKSAEIAKLASVKRVRAKDRLVVRVDSDATGEKNGHGRIKSLSALSDRFWGLWRGKKGVVEDVEEGVVVRDEKGKGPTR